MNVNGTTSTSGLDYQPPDLPDSGKTQQDEFLRLLVAQMQNQDPLNPQEGAEFVAQLAQFTNIELGLETNERLAGLQATGQSSSRAGMMDLVGKSIDAEFSRFRLTEDAQPLDLTLDLEGNANSVEVIISDETGDEVARIDLGNRGEGESSFSWDGTGTNGEPLPPGDYTVEIVATHESEGAIEARAQVSGIASSVEFTQDGATMFGFGSLLLDPGSILSLTAVSDA
jgi:flagellar basal-body rod modification protein FlgD